MPEDKDKKTDATDPTNDSETPEFDFGKWLEEQPDDVKQGLEAHTSGLKSALQKERDAAKEREAEDKKRKADAAAKKREAEEAERKRLEEQGEYQKLAEQSTTRAETAEKRIAELRPAAERVKVLEEAVAGVLEASKKDLPPHILALLEAMPAEKQLAYLAEHGESLRKPGGGGPDPTPDPDRDNDKITPEEKRKRAYFPRL